MARTRTFITVVLLSTFILGCAPRPPSWPPFEDELAETGTWYVDVERYQEAAHGGLACEDCHEDIVLGDASAPHPNVEDLTLAATSLYDYATCETCHPQEYAATMDGVHAEAMAAADPSLLESEPPTCGHCHNAHYATSQTRGELLATVSETCADCHQAAVDTYEENYHGKSAILGHERTATCADCHGAHTVLALQEPDESIPACQRCHPQATDTFVSHLIHAEETPNPDPDHPNALEFQILFWVKVFFTLLVVGVLAFFYTHTGLWFLRSLHERLRGKHRD
jgi:predicted CXXCH cytochrome family protein